MPQHNGYSVFTGVGERTRGRATTCSGVTESGVINKTALVMAEMNEPQEPGCVWLCPA